MEHIFEATTQGEDSSFSETQNESVKSLYLFSGMVLCIILYCLGYHFTGHLMARHVLFSALILLLYGLSYSSRMFLVLSIPFLFKNIIYDALQYIPFNSLRPIRVIEPYFLEKSVFGIKFHGSIVLLNEYLLRYSNSFLDFLCGALYFLHEPVAVLLVLVLWRAHSREIVERYGVAFLLMNLFAFITYILYPVAAPWYVAKYGFSQPMGPVMGDAAGLVKFEQLIGLNFLSYLYRSSPVVFGAIPSMHAGVTMLCLLYSFYTNKKTIFLVGIYTFSIWFAAVYLQHHYVIDLVIGGFYAVITYFIVEKKASSIIKNTYTWLFKYFVGGSIRPFFGKSYNFRRKIFAPQKDSSC